MLGGAILLVLLVLIFGIRACVGTRKDPSGTEENIQEEQEDPSSEKEETGTDAEEEEPIQMEEADADVVALIQNYYAAVEDKDVDTLHNLVEDLSGTTESQIANATDDVVQYQVGDVYTKPGLDENAQVVYVCVDYYCQGISTGVPALSRFYVEKDSDGGLKIISAEDEDSDIRAYLDGLQSDEDVIQLLARVKENYEAAQESDPQLKEFLSGLGEDATEEIATSDGPFVQANDDCNVRDLPNGDVIGGLSAGDQVEKLGVEDDWVKINYNGQEAYVYGSLVDDVEESE
jgi:uncharacterized protein YgiM (DUF1202 family)